MEKFGTKIDLLPNLYLNEDGTFDLERALNLCGKVAGVCYDEEGFKHLENESADKTDRRIATTLNNGHHSVYDHIQLNLNLQNVPKLLAMILNNEHQYTTSEKSARFTPVVRQEGSIITLEEERLYNKWLEKYKELISADYGNIHNEGKIQRLAQENARYLVTVFMPTQMIYTTSLRQANYIYSWLYDLKEELVYSNDEFSMRLVQALEEFLEELENKNILVPGLVKNEKNRGISLFNPNIENIEEYFGDVYSTNYEGSFAQLAQAQRHRTLNYKMKLLDDKKYFVPPIIEGKPSLVSEWFEDMSLVSGVIPQGELILINEMGTYDNFVLKCKERLCSGAQLEIMLQTKATLDRYLEMLKKSGNLLAGDLELYSRGARCTFPDYTCPKPCGFAEGINLTRRI